MMQEIVRFGYQAITFLGRSRLIHGRFLHQSLSMCGLDLTAKQAYQAPPDIDCARCKRVMERWLRQGRVLEYVE